MEIKEILFDDIVFDEKLYPRKSHDPALVQRYAENIDIIEKHKKYISISLNNKLLDGRHRHLAYQTVGTNENTKINVFVYQISNEKEELEKAVELNSTSGWQLTGEDKRRSAVKMYRLGTTQEMIAKFLSVGTKKVNDWLYKILEEERTERENTIFYLWLACHTQQTIADEVGLTHGRIAQFLTNLLENFPGKDSNIFANFTPQVYALWQFHKSTNKTKHFGNIPPEIIDNLLYYYTEPFDIVFDPFGGGGSTIDVCIERKRRYYVSDLTPIPARTDIREHDITQGLPKDLSVPKLIFLDPPYWKQAEGKYSEKETDLANMGIDDFLDAIGNIAKEAKRKWRQNGGKLAIIIGEYKKDNEYIDLPFLCYEKIKKYLSLIRRYQVPYSTQVHGGNFVKMAKENKECLYLNRDLMVFGNGR